MSSVPTPLHAEMVTRAHSIGVHDGVEDAETSDLVLSLNGDRVGAMLDANFEQEFLENATTEELNAIVIMYVEGVKVGFTRACDALIKAWTE